MARINFVENFPVMLDSSNITYQLKSAFNLLACQIVLRRHVGGLGQVGMFV
jgi:hypothetical protein